MPAARVSGAEARCSQPRRCGLTSATVSANESTSDSRASRSASFMFIEVSIGTVDEWKERVRRLLYPAYEARMLRALPKDKLPQHIGVMLDGNRRWAKGVGGDSTHGYRAGAANIEPLLEWSEEVGVRVVTLWLLSTDNLNRPPEQLEGLLTVIGDAVHQLAERGRWRIHPVGALDLLPAALLTRLKEAEEATRDVEGILVNVAVPYGGRRE